MVMVTHGSLRTVACSWPVGMRMNMSCPFPRTCRTHSLPWRRGRVRQQLIDTSQVLQVEELPQLILGH